MTSYPISDYDRAYANAAHIPQSETYPGRWAAEAAAFRVRLASQDRARLDLRYGAAARNRLDLFMPEGKPRGLAVYVHGGYWKAFAKSDWSHLAAGALAHGFAVAVPQYTLCPDVFVGGIGIEVAGAVTAVAEEIGGPIRLAGHSAGGQLVTRLISGSQLLEQSVLERITGVVSISGVHDLRPLIKTAMNDILKIDEEEAANESPALLRPLVPAEVIAWVGAGELPEFLRQNRILHEMWRGFETRMRIVEAEGMHHFNVIDGLADPEHPLCRAFVGTMA